MAELSLEIKVLSPIHLSSGQADVNIDSEIFHRHTSNNVQLIVPKFFIYPPDEARAQCRDKVLWEGHTA